MNYYFLYFKESIIIIFYKSKGIRDYINLKSYWLISLLNILKKIIKVILTIKISYIATTYYLLSKIHLENQHGLFIKIIIYHFLKKFI